MLYGVSYYPEHKSKEELYYDLKLLVESGINTVRMGEFAWCRWEPQEGCYETEWMDQVIEYLGQHGIKTIICTPTACPPAWLIDKYPDILYMDNRGVIRPFGGRRHYCYNNETYRAYSRKIANMIGQHYGDNPYIVGFQIDNELAQEGTGRCHCAVCNRKFQIYLEKKYGTIAEFNKKSGSIFWSQEYGNFNQINIPVNTIEMGGVNCISNFYENPTICLEFERFASDSLIEYQDIQLNELRSFTKSPITTNATGLATNSIDYYKSTKRLDNYAFDFYPGLRNAEIDSYHYAFARGVKEGKHFWVLEFMSGGGHRLKGSGRQQPNPGALKQAVLHAYANGADLMLHFQFRSFPFGSEQLNYAIVDTDGVPRRRYYEMKETSELLKKLEKYQSAYFDNQVAICIDYAVYWALRIKPVNNSKFQYHSFCSKLYNSLAAIGINADVISYNADFSKYKMVILPSTFILSKKNRQKFKAYVKNGGVLFSTFLTSVKNENNVGYVETLPAGMTDLFGITVEEVEPIFDSNQATVRLKMEDKHIDTLDCGWCDLLAPVLSSENHTNCMIGNYIDSYKAGQGVISKNEYGKGTAYYMGTDINEDAMGELFDFICTEHNIFKNPFKNIKGVQIFRRVWEGQFLYYIFNFTNSVQVLKLSHVYYDCVSDMLVEDEVEIPQIGFIVLRECIVE